MLNDAYVKYYQLLSTFGNEQSNYILEGGIFLSSMFINSTNDMPICLQTVWVYS